MKLTVLDLYAGTGRCAEPFRRWHRTSKIILADNSDYAREVYLENFPKANYLSRNLAVTSAADLLTLCGGRVDILLGCPPCQGFSDCGKKEEGDPRNNHVSRFKNIIVALKPRAVVMENVPLAVESPKFASMTEELEKHGYQWTSIVTNAALWGSCQTRQRMILVAFCKDLKSQPAFPSPTHGGAGHYFCYSSLQERRLTADPARLLGHAPAAKRSLGFYAAGGEIQFGSRSIPRVGETIGDLPELGTKKAERLGHKKWLHVTRTLRRMGAVAEGHRWNGGRDHYSQTYGRLHHRGLARTITAYFANAGSGRFWHPTDNRALSLREAARIQGFPDSFKFGTHDTNNCLLVGNALDSALANLAFRVVRAGFG